jgi:hypothetical protein
VSPFERVVRRSRLHCPGKWYTVSLMRNLWKCLLPAVLLAMVGPAAAQAESLVYIKGGDVYLTGAPGTVRVTTDGNYESSSQADDGTIVAVQKGVDNDGQTYRYLIRMNRSGKRLNPPVETINHISTYSGPFNAKVSPDGRLVVYDWLAGGPLLTPIRAVRPRRRNTRPHGATSTRTGSTPPGSCCSTARA